MKKIIVGLVVLLINISAAHAGDAPAAAQACMACHGKNGVSSNPEWPNLAGQKAGYLVRQLQAFRDGERSNPAMAPFVNNLSDKDIEVLAAFYAGQTTSRTANGDAGLVAAGENLSAYCKSCHGMQGTPAADVWPQLAGQHAAYLQKQLAAFRSGERQNAHMQTVVKSMGDPEFAALAAYYSQLAP